MVSQAMCGLYVLLGLAWLLVCAIHWRDILRIQFWIGDTPGFLYHEYLLNWKTKYIFQ